MEFSEFLTLLLPAAIAFGAAWAGAYFAFRFQNQKQEERKTTSEIDAINSTMVTLGQMNNELSAFKRQVIDPFVHLPLRAIAMLPSDIGDCLHLVLHADALSFLCETDHRQVPVTVGYTYTLFRRAVSMIDQHATHHINVIQPAMAERDDPLAPITDEIINELLTADQRALQESLTDSMVQYVDDASKQIDTCIDELNTAGKALYEKGRTVTTRLQNDHDQTDDG
jgi:hypothetical protein